jgi:hypothetical protein
MMTDLWIAVVASVISGVFPPVTTAALRLLERGIRTHSRHEKSPRAALQNPTEGRPTSMTPALDGEFERALLAESSSATSVPALSWGIGRTGTPWQPLVDLLQLLVLREQQGESGEDQGGKKEHVDSSVRSRRS